MVGGEMLLEGMGDGHHLCCASAGDAEHLGESSQPPPDLGCNPIETYIDNY